ncbi:armadillo repeat-containing protein 8-like protein [Dinothrombium tinctorium]|uniref:Armadillo repeat-containing protein 8 n=1 Tax=Dinothrombium tinctorium TaxID=1965070 RepID=A0A443RCK8_9ACAR|nr:armadillo repeat-containing protein 8-like protein [Dinothrombium tinctorium]
MYPLYEQYSTGNERDEYVALIFADEEQKWMKAVPCIKNLVIGSNKQKQNIIEMAVLPRLLLLMSETSNDQLVYEIGATICSLTKGTESHMKAVLEAGTVPVLIKVLTESHFRNSPNVINICLRALRTIFMSSIAPVNLVYDENNGAPLIHTLLNFVRNSNNWSNQECVVNILAHSCQTSEHQSSLCNYGVVEIAANLLLSPVYKVQLPALYLISQICYQNEIVSTVVTNTVCNGKSMPDILEQMMCQDKTFAMQLAAARCMTYLYRAGALNSEDRRIVYQTLPTLCRMCTKEIEPGFRCMAADILAYLTEIDTELQKTASICDHVILSLADFFKWQPSNTSSSSSNLSPEYHLGESMNLSGNLTSTTARKLEQELSQEMKQSAFKAFASLGANDEEIRKKIIETDMLMEHIVNGLSENNNKTRLAALRCLHSLSRSVQQLRTTFQDHAVWIPLRNLLHNAPDDVLTVASSTLCNLLLEFSPTKQHFLDRTAVDLLCGLTKREEPALRLNGVWALMNMTFQTDQNVKLQILSSLGTDQIFRLLEDSDSNIVLKTLGLIRNLLSNKPHIDHIMGLHGKQMMQAVTMILDGDNSCEVKEQALCILANIADGETAKDFIMSNEELLLKLIDFMSNNNVKLQIAAIFCISNLIWNEEDGAIDRQMRLKELGVQKKLQQLLTTTDTTLFDRVKTALQHFA